MKPIRYTSGVTMLSILFIIAIASFFVTIIKEQAISTNRDITISLLDGNIAKKISKLGVQLGLNEVRNNSNFANQYISGVNILDSHSTDEIFGIPDGIISLQLFSPTGNLNNDSIQIISTGNYKNTIRTTTLTVNKITKKNMLLIQPTITPDNQFNARIATFENFDWTITILPEGEIDVGSAVLNPVVAMPWNLIYIPQNISINKDYFTDVQSPVATETIADASNLGIIATSILSPDSFITTLRTAITSATHPPNVPMQFSSSLLNFRMSVLNRYVDGIVHEFTLDSPAAAYPTIPPDKFSVISWLPTGEIRSNGTASPQARILLNIVPSDAYPWALYNSIGIQAINTVLEYVSCNNTDCSYFEIYDVQNSTLNIEIESPPTAGE